MPTFFPFVGTLGSLSKFQKRPGLTPQTTTPAWKDPLDDVDEWLAQTAPKPVAPPVSVPLGQQQVTKPATSAWKDPLDDIDEWLAQTAPKALAPPSFDEPSAGRPRGGTSPLYDWSDGTQRAYPETAAPAPYTAPPPPLTQPRDSRASLSRASSIGTTEVAPPPPARPSLFQPTALVAPRPDVNLPVETPVTPKPTIPLAQIRPPAPGEVTYFKAHRDTPAMATEDNFVTFNPFVTMSDQDREALRLNESVRIAMGRQKYEPTSSLTAAQRKTIKGWGGAYASDETLAKQTIVARILSGDDSLAPYSKEQQKEAETFQRGGKAAEHPAPGPRVPVAAPPPTIDVGPQAVLGKIGFEPAPLPTAPRQPGEPAAPASGPTSILGPYANRGTDYAISALKGAISLPEAAIGLVDLATRKYGAAGGGNIGAMLASLGFDTKTANAVLDQAYSEAQQRANLAVQEAGSTVRSEADIKRIESRRVALIAAGADPLTAGMQSHLEVKASPDWKTRALQLRDKAVAVLSHPSVLAHNVVQSLPLMGAGAVTGGAAVAAAGPGAAMVGGAMGEGLAQAGQAAEQTRQQLGVDRLSDYQAGLVAASGVFDTAITLFGGKLAAKLGIADVDTMLAGAATNAIAQKGLARQVRGFMAGMVQEGLIEELPQSIQEQILQNLAVNEPWDKGVTDAAVLGAFAGAVMSGGAQITSAAQDRVTQPATVPATPAAPTPSGTTPETAPLPPEISRPLGPPTAAVPVEPVAAGAKDPLAEVDKWLSETSPLPAGTQSRLRATGVPESEIGRMTIAEADAHLAGRAPETPLPPAEAEAAQRLAGVGGISIGPEVSGADEQRAAAARAAEEALYEASKAERERAAAGFQQTSPAAQENVRLTAERAAEEPAAAAPKREYSSTQVNLPVPDADAVRALGQQIPEKDLADDGREETPHVTVKYGLHTADVQKVQAVLADEGPITVTLGKTSVFPAKETGGEYDVVKVDVDSPDLRRLNTKIAGSLEVTDTHPTYQPHVTVAYVKAGTGAQYAGDASLEGRTITLDAITFASKDGENVSIPLTGQPPAPAVGPAATVEPPPSAVAAKPWKQMTDVEKAAFLLAEIEAEDRAAAAATVTKPAQVIPRPSEPSPVAPAVGQREVPDDYYNQIRAVLEGSNLQARRPLLEALFPDYATAKPDESNDFHTGIWGELHQPDRFGAARVPETDLSQRIRAAWDEGRLPQPEVTGRQGQPAVTTIPRGTATPPAETPTEPATPPRARFLAVYGDALTAAIQKDPGSYGYPASQAPAVAEKMATALPNGSANTNSPALRAAAKTLGIKNTNAAWKAFFGTSEAVPAEPAPAAPEAPAKSPAAAPEAPGELHGFLEGVSPMRAGSLRKTLGMQIRSNGEFATRAALVERRVKDGGTVVTEGGERRLMSPEGTYLAESQISKVAMDYAGHLIARRGSKPEGWRERAPGKLTTEDVRQALTEAAPKEVTKPEAVAATPGTGAMEAPYSVASMRRAFNLTDAQAEAADALVQAMGIDTDSIRVVKGGTPGDGALYNPDVLEQRAVARNRPPNTPEFKQWFGRSVVALKSGVARIAYHGTTADITEFHGKGYAGWFGSAPVQADAYAQPAQPTGGVIYPVYLSLQKPLDLTALDLNHSYVKKGRTRAYGRSVPMSESDLNSALDDALRDNGIELEDEQIGRIADTALEGQQWFGYPEMWRIVHSPVFAALVEEHGFDGIVARERQRGGLLGTGEATGPSEYSWAVLKPEQVKSAVANRGTFDPNDPSILLQQPIYQGVKGAVEFAVDGKTIIRGLAEADISTAVHEIAHVARRQLINRNVPADERQGITLDDIEAAEAWAGAEDGVWTVPAEEKFARGYERYLRDGFSPLDSLIKIFDAISRWLQGIYETLQGSAVDVKISPAMTEVFDKLSMRLEHVKTGRHVWEESEAVSTYEFTVTDERSQSQQIEAFLEATDAHPSYLRSIPAAQLQGHLDAISEIRAQLAGAKTEREQAKAEKDLDISDVSEAKMFIASAEPRIERELKRREGQKDLFAIPGQEAERAIQKQGADEGRIQRQTRARDEGQGRGVGQGNAPPEEAAGTRQAQEVANEWRGQDVVVQGQPRKLGEVVGGTLYHGTRAVFEPGALIEPGHGRNFQQSASGEVSITSESDRAGLWGARTPGDAPVHVYKVEPVGLVRSHRVGLANQGRNIILYEGRVTAARVVRAQEEVTPARTALIDQIGAAAREPKPDIVRSGNGYAIRASNGTTVGTREATAEAVLTRWQKAQDAKTRDFRARLEEMSDERLQSQAAYWLKDKAPKTPAPAAATPSGATVSFNHAQSGVEIKFPAKPTPEVIAAVKAAGYRWSKREGHWYRKVKPSEKDRALAAAQELVGTPAPATKAEQPAKTTTIDAAEASKLRARLRTVENQLRGENLRYEKMLTEKVTESGRARTLELIHALERDKAEITATLTAADAMPTTWKVGDRVTIAEGTGRIGEMRGPDDLGITRALVYFDSPKAGQPANIWANTTRLEPEAEAPLTISGLNDLVFGKTQAVSDAESERAKLEAENKDLIAKLKAAMKAPDVLLQDEAPAPATPRINQTALILTARLVSNYVQMGVVNFPEAVRRFQEDYGEGARDLDRYFSLAWQQEMGGERLSVADALKEAYTEPGESHGTRSETPGPRRDDAGQLPERGGAAPVGGGGAGEGALGAVQPESGDRAERPGTARPGDRDSGGVVADGVPEPAGGGAQPEPASRPTRGTPSGRALDPTGATRYPGTAAPDYILTPERIEAITSRSAQARARDNIAAIKIAKALIAEKRYATPDEQDALARYVGWGATDLAGYLNDYPNDNWSRAERAIYDDLLETATEEERKALAQSTPNAHYTFDLYRPIWAALERFGFRGGRVLEPAVGSGHALGLMPSEVHAASTINAVELEPLTAAIAQALFPSARVQAVGYQDARLARGTQDLIISNVPFGSFGVVDKHFAGAKAFLTDRIHNYFFAKALEHVRPGGVILFVSSRFTMDSQKATAVRRYLMSKAHFLGAVRLPNTAFDKGAKTSVVTDIIVLQRFLPGETTARNGEAFIHAPEQPKLAKAADGGRDYNNAGEPIRVYRSQWYDDHPELILGNEGMGGKMYGGRAEYTVTPHRGALPDQITTGLETVLPTDGYVPASTKATEPDALVEGEYKPGEFRVAPKGDAQVRIQRVNRDGSIADITPRRVVNKQTGETAPDLPAVNRLTGMIGIRDLLRDTLTLMRNPEQSDASIVKAQGALSKAYRRFVEGFGTLNNPTNKRLFRDDPESTNLLGLEVITPTAEFITKDGAKVLKVSYSVTGLADIFTKRTVQASRVIEHVDTPKDALLASLGVKTRIDWDYIAQVQGVDVDAAQATLRGEGHVFEQPDGSWVTADEYLSGDVVSKLRDAEAAADEDPERFRTNIEALTAVQPTPKTKDDLATGIVAITLGSHWVPIDDLQAFVRAQLPRVEDPAEISLISTETYARWTTKYTDAAKRVGQRHPLAVPYGPKGPKGEQALFYGFTDLLDDALNLNQPDLGWWEGHGDDREYHKDPLGTKAARANLEELRALWMQWVFENEDLQTRLLDNFNTRYNRTVKRSYDGSHLANIVDWDPVTKTGTRTAALPGLSLPFPLFPHQLQAIWRTLTTGNTLLAHEVGAGKTFEMIVTAMEMRRTGRARKPLITVPTNLLGQWRGDILAAYPAAKLLAFDEKDLAADKRQQAMARIAFGDWDIVLVPHSSFGLLKVSDQRMIDVMQRWVDELMDAEKASIRSSGRGKKDDTAKKLAAARARIEQKIARKMESLNHSDDNALTWEDLGVDALLVDEATVFKNLYFFSKIENIRGLSKSEADRSLDLFVKIQDINEQSNYRNLVLATATPVMNSVAELYTMQRYLQPHRLREQGLENFDNWYQMFASALPTTEQRPDGTYQEVQRLREFRNLNLLYKTVSEVMDYVGWEDMPYLKLPKLKGGRVNVVETEPHPMYETLRTWFADRLEALRQIPPHVDQNENEYVAPERMHPLTGTGMGKPDNILTVMTDAKKAAIDVRLVLGDAAKDVPTSRIQTAARDIAQIYREERDRKGVQLVFLDMGTPKTTEPLAFMRGVKIEDETEGGALGVEDEDIDAGVVVGEDLESEFNLYGSLKQALVALGIPAREIAFIHQARNAAERLALFQAANAGTVRVVIASTDKGGMGMNIQQRLAHIAHIDAPRAQRPGDIRQRDGRGIRQGNSYDEIRISRYVTKGTTDEWLYGLLNTKSTIITQFMRGDISHFVDDDPSTMSIEEAQIRATGDPRGIELTELRASLPRLQAQSMAAERGAAQARAMLSTARQQKAYWEKDLRDIEAWLPNFATQRGDAFHVTVGTVEFTKRAEADAAFEAALGRITDEAPLRKIGSIGGLAIQAERVTGNFYLTPESRKTVERDRVSVTLDGAPFGGSSIQVFESDPTTSGEPVATKGQSLSARIVNQYEDIQKLKPQAERVIQGRADQVAEAEAILARPNPARDKAVKAEARIVALQDELRAEGIAKDKALGQELKQPTTADEARPRYRIREIRIGAKSHGQPTTATTSAQNPDLLTIAGVDVAGVKVGQHFGVHKVRKWYRLSHLPTGTKIAEYNKRASAIAVGERLTELGGAIWNNADQKALVKSIPENVRTEAMRLQKDNEADALAEARKKAAAKKRPTPNKNAPPALTGGGGTEAFGFVEPVSASVAIARRLWQTHKARQVAETTPLVASSIAEVEARWQAARGIQPESIRQKAREALDTIRKITRHFPEINPSRSILEATVHELLLDQERAPKWAQLVAHNRIANITDGLVANEADLLTRALVLPDILKDVEEGLYAGTKELPFGYTDRQQVEADLEEVQATVAKTPSVRAAVTKRQAFVGQLTQELVDAELLKPDVLNDPRYYHRQVMAYMSAQDSARVGAGGREVRQRTRGFQRGRVGGGDFNTRYVEAEFEWVAQALTELKTKSTLDLLKALADRTGALKAQAKGINRERLGAHLAEVAGLDPVTDGPGLAAEALQPYSQRLAYSIAGVLDALADGEYEVSDRFADVVGELTDAYQGWKDETADMDKEDRPLFDANHPLWWPLLSDLVQHSSKAGKHAGAIFKAIRTREQFIETTLGRAYVDRKNPEDLATLAPEGYVAWQPKEGNHFFRAQSVDSRILEAVIAGDRHLTEADRRTVVAMGGTRETWIVPDWLAATLDHFGIKAEAPGPLGSLDRAWNAVIATWKQQMLMFPMRVIRYNLNNASGDSDAALAYAPGIFAQVPNAAAFMYHALYGKNAPEGMTHADVNARVERLVELGVMEAGLTALEIPDVNELPGFRRLAESDPHTFMAWLVSLGPKYYHEARKITQYRENILRVAAYNYLLPRVKAGEVLYAASNPARVDALRRQANTVNGQERLAALLGRDLIGDYQDVSAFTQFMRTRTLPFFSFQEVNFKRYLRLFGNITREGGSGGSGGGSGAGGPGPDRGPAARAAQIAGVWTAKTGFKWTKRIVLVNLFMVAVLLWNKLFFPDEADELKRRGRQQLHLILGRHEDGSIRSMRIEGAFADFLEWAGLQNYIADIHALVDQDITISEKLIEMGKATPNKVVQLWEPFTKMLFEQIAGRKTFPDVFRPTPIRDRGEYLAGIAALDRLYGWVTGKPAPPGNVLARLVFYRTDPGEASYYDMRAMVQKWLDANGKERPAMDPTEKSNALYYWKRAMQWGDEDAEYRWRIRYADLGGTTKGMKESLVRGSPLGSLSLKDQGQFLREMRSEDRAELAMAEAWYQRVYGAAALRRRVAR